MHWGGHKSKRNKAAWQTVSVLPYRLGEILEAFLVDLRLPFR